jgi:hypothetical protein
LLARTAHKLGGAQGDAGAVHAQVHGRRHRRCGLDDLPLVMGDLDPQRLGGALDLFGPHTDTGQLAEQVAALDEADPRGPLADHARDRRRQGAALHAQRTVARTEPVRARGAVVVGTLERHRPQGRGEGLLPAAGVAGRFATARAGQRQPVEVGSVGVELALDHSCGHGQRLLPRPQLDGFEAQIVNAARPYERLDLGEDVGLEGPLEPLFSAPWASEPAAASSSASAHCSQARQ